MEHPIRLPQECFSKLNFLPLPLLGPRKEHFQTFDMVYGKPLSEKDRPSYVVSPSEEAKQSDKHNSSILVCTKVRSCIQCDECHKSRCAYAQCKLTLEEMNEISRIKEAKLYTCGYVLFPPGSKYEKSIVAREALTCNSTIKTQYYGSKLISFPPICYHCGIGEECFIDYDKITELKKKYAVVYPICFICTSDGKKPFCKLPSNVAKQRKS